MKKSARQTIIQKLFPYYPLAVMKGTAAERKILAWTESHGTVPTFQKALRKIPDAISNDHAIGVEIEMENVSSDFHSNVPPGWSYTGDNSLRENGLEFITRPMTPELFRPALAALMAHVSPSGAKRPSFSWRTSIHVHLNVRGESVENVCNLLLLYMLFEDSLFSFVGEDRRTNNFCVPLTETAISRELTNLFQDDIPLGHLLGEWMKYTALNPRPIRYNDHGGEHGSGKGTIEFRHLAGTYDLVQIMTWINLILCLQNFSRSVPLEDLEERILAINTKQDYLVLFNAVFGPLAGTMPVSTKEFNRILCSSVAYTKECFCPAPDLKELAKHTAKQETGLAEMLKIRTKYKLK